MSTTVTVDEDEPALSIGSRAYDTVVADPQEDDVVDSTRTDHLADAVVVLAAIAAGVGAWLAPPIPLALGVAGLCGAMWRRSRVAFVVAVLLLTGARANDAHDGLRAATSASIDGWVTLVDDPRPVPGGVQVTLRDADGARWAASGHGAATWSLANAAAGDRARVVGRTRTWADQDLPVPGWALSRHVAGRMRLDTIGERRPGALPWRGANLVRRIVTRGADALSPRQRGLFQGVVLGDGRSLDPVQESDFRAAGLSHLMVVSGQNVAFVLALAQPALERLGRRRRLAGALFVVLAFGTITRWEPSVLRASAMAALTLFSRTIGRDVSALRVLALCCIALLVADPFLVASVGFALSVAATLGLALLREPIAGVLRGPRWFRTSLAAILAAQLGVAPLSSAWFGGVPVAAIPANFVAGALAGPVMTYGAVAGIAAGLWGGTVADWLHGPTRALLWALDACARTGASLPLGRLPGPLIALVVVAVSGALWSRRRTPVAARVVTVLVLGSGVFVTASALRVPAAHGAALGDGATLWRADGWRWRPPVTVVSLCGTRDAGAALDALRRVDVDAISVLVPCRGGRNASRVVEGVASRIPIRTVLVSDQRDWSTGLSMHRVDPDGGGRLRIGEREVHVVVRAGRLVVEPKP